MPKELKPFVAVIPPDQEVYKEDEADGQVEAQNKAGGEQTADGEDFNGDED